MSYRKDVSNIIKDSRWTFFKSLPLLLIILTILWAAGFFLHSIGYFGQTIVERKIFENSYQYTEAKKTEIATFEAQLAEIEYKLNSNIDEQTRINLEAQKAALKINLNVARSK